NQFVYRFPGNNNKESYDLYSLGPDGIESSDDFRN
ncbi:MAG: type II secretion system protein GspG, partial [Verrucomicrobiae bacterium]|nr:type II secretion system protein GspG [Verrucomicrobiae bacterium]